jgi:hypothetical protein
MMKNIKFCILILLLGNLKIQAQNEVDKNDQTYEKATLSQKYEMNKVYAIKEVLPILTSYQIKVDDVFAGVKNFGKLITNTNFSEKQNVSLLTANNSNYWRATMEMELGNQLIPTTKIFMLVSQGEFDYAFKYIEMIKLFSKKETIANKYLIDLSNRLEIFNNHLHSEIEKGIVEHDKKNFDKAISIYKEILKQYPHSAWANFELYYSQSELNKLNDEEKLNTIENWNKLKNNILDHNPLYGLPIGLPNPEDAYFLYRRNSIKNLFKTKDSKQKLNDVYIYADIAMDLKIYDFAAQLFWLTFSYDNFKDESLNKFLYCLDKLGVTDLKQVFKGNFEKEFSKIEKEKLKEMTKSEVYKHYSKN